MKISILILILAFISPFSQATTVNIDGKDTEWSSLHRENSPASSQVYNTNEYIYVSYSNKKDTRFIPISNNDITFFIKDDLFTSYLSFGRSIVKDDDNNHMSKSHLKITLNNGVPTFKYLKPINHSYIQDIKFKTKKINGKYFTEIAIPKRLFGKSSLSETVTFANVYSGIRVPIANKVNAKSLLPDGVEDFTDITITVGISVSGIGTNVAGGLAGDDKGLGGYFDGTGGDADFGISLDIGVFQGDISSLNGLTIGSSTPIKGVVDVKYEQPVNGSPLGRGFTFSLNLFGGYAKIPDMQLTYGSAGYIITNKEVLNALGFDSDVDNSNSGNDNDWNSDNDNWGHDDDHGPSYGGSDGDWSNDDDDNSGYF